MDIMKWSLRYIREYYNRITFGGLTLAPLVLVCHAYYVMLLSTSGYYCDLIRNCNLFFSRKILAIMPGISS